MKLTFIDRSLLGLIAVFLGVMALRPLFQSEVVSAQSQLAHVYIEPGTKMINSPDKSQRFLGKVVVDLSTGNVWGFPTLADVPYPVDAVKTTPPTSTPTYLGRFDFSAMSQGR